MFFIALVANRGIDFVSLNLDLSLDQEKKNFSETAAATFWPDHPDILAGRDLRNGGTWCGVTRGGRFALLTNFRERDPGRVAGAPSRGALPLDFLRGAARPLEYLRGLDLARHNGFNLVVGDLNGKGDGEVEVAYVTNRKSSSPSKAAAAPAAADNCAETTTKPSSSSSPSPSPPFPTGEPVLLPPGVYGLSNGVLGDSWCKVERGVAVLKGMLERGEFDDEKGGGGDENGSSLSSSSSSTSLPWDALFRSLMGDTSRAPAHLVPETGVPRHIEERLTPTFVTPFELLPKGGGGGGGGAGGGAPSSAATAATTTPAAETAAAAAELKKYGTRSQTALAVFAGGRAALRERRLVSWRERGGAAVAAGGEEEERASSPTLPAPPFKLDGCPIESEWREVAHEFTVRSPFAGKKEKEEKELVVDEAEECATVAAGAAEEGGEETELKT